MNHRWVARGLVVGLHLLVLAALWLHKPAPLPNTGDRRLTTVRIIPQTREESPRFQAPVPRLRVPLNIDDFHFPPTPSITVEPQGPAPESTPPPAVNIPPAPAEPPRTTLRLTLPPGFAASSAATRNPALTDPRSNTARRTIEDRIADALGGSTGEWSEERTSDNRSQAVGAQGDHRTVLRRGDTCVEIFRSRIADTDSFNGNVAPRAVSMMGKPYKCK